MQIPWIMYVGGASHALPLLVAAVKRPSLGPARTWVLIWCGFMASMSTLSLFQVLAGQHNHWLHYTMTPVAAGLVLWALSYWQVSDRLTLAVRVLIPLIVIAWIPIVLAFEDTRTFSVLGEPFVGLVVLVVATLTLAARSLRERGSMMQQDWFWVSLGLAFYHGAAVALQPASYWLLANHRELVIVAYKLNAVVEIIAFLLISWGTTRVMPPFGDRIRVREPASRRSGIQDQW